MGGGLSRIGLAARLPKCERRRTLPAHRGEDLERVITRLTVESESARAFLSTPAAHGIYGPDEDDWWPEER